MRITSCSTIHRCDVSSLNKLVEIIQRKVDTDVLSDITRTFEIDNNVALVTAAQTLFHNKAQLQISWRKT